MSLDTQFLLQFTFAQDLNSVSIAISKPSRPQSRWIHLCPLIEEIKV